MCVSAVCPLQLIYRAGAAALTLSSTAHLGRAATAGLASSRHLVRSFDYVIGQMILREEISTDTGDFHKSGHFSSNKVNFALLLN